MTKEEWISALQYCGCEDDDISLFIDQKVNRTLFLKKVRCRLLEKTHKCQKKLDCLDYMIYRMKQEDDS